VDDKEEMLMQRQLWSVLGLLGMLSVTSASAKDRDIPDPDPQLGAIGVTIQSRGPLAISSRPHASVVFFVNVDEGVDMQHAEEVLASSFSAKNQVYLLNAKPGRYVMVGAYTPEFTSNAKNVNDMPSTNIYFDHDMVPATEVTVQAGQITFAGEIIVKVSVGMKHADETQTYYGQLLGNGVGMNVDVSIGRGVATTGFEVGHLTRAGTLQSLDKDPQTEREFWERAVKSVFKDEPSWLDLVRRQLETMK
jgi:hypothetical protein